MKSRQIFIACSFLFSAAVISAGAVAQTKTKKVLARPSTTAAQPQDSTSCPVISPSCEVPNPVLSVGLGGSTVPDDRTQASVTAVLPMLDILSCGQDLTYLPLPELYVSNYTETTLKKGKAEMVSTTWDLEDTKEKKKLLRTLLPNIASEIVVEDTDDEGNVKGIFGFSRTVVNKHVTIDLIKYRTEPILDSESQRLLFYATVGAGLRLKITVHTNDASLDVGNLLNLAIGVKSGAVSGQISSHVIGMDSNDLNAAMPFTYDLSEASVQKMIEALAIVRAKFNDDNTSIRPHLLAKVTCQDKKKKSESVAVK